MKKKAVILLNLGGPSTLEDVEPFLLSLFSDPAILSLPNPLRYLLAKLISKRRLKEARHIYSLLGGGSPLLKNTKDQAQALSDALGANYGVFVAMRHAPPFAQETLEDVKKFSPDEVILLPLYPQYSTTTTKSALKDWIKKSKTWGVPLRYVPSYPTEEGFIGALRDLTLPYLEKVKKFGSPRILLTAHGLPERTIRKGDPYQNQIEETAQCFLKSLKIPFLDAVLCYQSRVGPLKWIGPYTEEEIQKAAQEKKPVVVVPLSFVSEHSETLVELDITYRNLAYQKGCPSYQRVPTVQTHPFFIKGLATLVKEKAIELKE